MDAIDLEYPFAGRWLTRNSPASAVPSHGTTRFASSYAIDFVPVDGTGRSAPLTLGSLVRSEDSRRFTGFGRPVTAPVAGTVVGVENDLPDHDSYRGLPSVGYALTQARRLRAGWRALAGNHVLIDAGGVVVALCHLRRGSVEVGFGQDVAVGERVGGCGNSGNSTEPHVHVQAVDDPVIEHAVAVPVMFRGELPRNGRFVDVDAHG
ncbi:peptidase [Pseudonocardia sp. EC080610-09]|uniref:M23 family metallopeptidase n=1 Tax=unclassified Pseudonocardia TaxID=2619320 RepID=UPI0006CB63F3|nr:MULTISPECIES: M23 family metallopeptidase [unclassified Pseudonocardia]ALE73524.1 peptidase [Pseudonocardia sp. EC080625-04]ALL76950.1 peptidase [Pseudonocardia sp. EC080610-09]ALL83981.1 peptidase [Pseudonocardia sp. EC080619-01]